MTALRRRMTEDLTLRGYARSGVHGAYGARELSSTLKK